MSFSNVCLPLPQLLPTTHTPTGKGFRGEHPAQTLGPSPTPAVKLASSWPQVIPPRPHRGVVRPPHRPCYELGVTGEQLPPAWCFTVILVQSHDALQSGCVTTDGETESALPAPTSRPWHPFLRACPSEQGNTVFALSSRVGLGRLTMDTERKGWELSLQVCCGAQHPGPSDQGEAVCSLEPHIPGAETQGEEDIQEHEPPSPPSQSQLSQLHVSECLPTHRCKQSPRPPPVPTPAPPGWDSQKPGRATVQSEQRPREERGLSGLGAELSSQPDPQAPSLPAPLHRTHGLGPQGDFKTPQTMPRGGGREQPQWVRSHLLRSPFCKPWPGASEPCWRLLKH